MMIRLHRARVYEILLLVAAFHFCFCFPRAQAEQIFTVRNNGIISANASSKELTRIAFENDEVDSIYALSGEMIHEVKNNNLFIKLKSEKTINFFILTKNANVYKVILRPKNIKATQLFVRNGATTEQKSSTYSEEKLLRQNIAAIIRVALANENKAGFEVNIDENNMGKYGQFYLKSQAIVSGRGLTAKKILVTNTEDRFALLSNTDFKRIKLSNFLRKEFCHLAVYLEKTSLQPFESTHLIVVTKNEERHV